MKKFMLFITATTLAVAFSAFTTTPSKNLGGLWYEDPNSPGVYHEYTGSIDACLPAGQTECFLPVEEENGTICPIFFDNQGQDPVKYQAR